MKILILGAGKMGSFFTDLLSFDHEVAVLEKDPKRMRFIYNALRLQNPEEVKDFNPELVINCVTLSYTIEAFKAVMPYLQPYCIISDIASVKTYLKEFYETCGFPYVSTHPMFGPTFANLGQLEKENTIIIFSESLSLMISCKICNSSCIRSIWRGVRGLKRISVNR